MKWNPTVLGFAAAAALAWGAATIATADVQTTYNDGIQRSLAYYNAAHDRVSSTDAYNEGWGSRARWEVNNNIKGKVDNTQGAVSTIYAYPDLVFATQIRVRSCSINNGVEVGCGSFSAWGGI